MKYIKEGKGKLKYNKLGIAYLRLNFIPSDTRTQDIVLGIDPGASYDGFSVVSNNLHHENINTEHTRKIKDRMIARSMYRRIRRSRLWHRKARFNNRTASKLPPTILSKLIFKKYVVERLCELYPINNVVIEDVKFDHSKSKDGKFFSLVEVGKNTLYAWLKTRFQLELADAWQTKKLRVEIFGEELKSKDIQKSFFSHCIDSYSIISHYCVSELVNTKVRYLTKINMVRRELHKYKAMVKDKAKFFKYSKGGVKVFFIKMSKPSKIRVKETDSKSNHGPWSYTYNEPSECLKKFRSNYGGTIKIGRSKHEGLIGKSKYSNHRNEVLLNYRRQKLETIK